MVSIWWVRPSAVNDHDRSLLSASELARMERMGQPADRDRFAAAWSLARRQLGELTGLPPRSLTFSRSCENCAHPSHGRPRLTFAGPQFSLSHSGDRVLLAVCERQRVGADVEQVGRDIDGLRRLVLHPEEPAEIAGMTLLRLWVRKEALLKVTGLRVTQMARLNAAAPPPGVRVWDTAADDGYVAAVATMHSADPPRFARRR
ncbi:4'-phosphopantetheinyl transferase superfamily protein [Micromonospora sp. CPCC 205539]|uniref:4'-phosphopantetheinyl transferase family protein n=1 Tax=Micromonospora sp. CPCC 205539 TaxID=3122408 RepID=UPI002FEEA6A1